MQVKILLADDHTYVRKGVKFMFESHFGVKEVDEVGSCNALMRQLKRKPYTHLVLDLVLSDGITLEILPNIRALYPELKILIFSMQEKNLFFPALSTYGIKSFLSKEMSEPDSVVAFSNFLYNVEVEEVLTVSHPDFETNLSPRELIIFNYIISGKGTTEIGKLLNIKQNTVSTFKSRIFEKVNVANELELMKAFAIYKFQRDVSGG